MGFASSLFSMMINTGATWRNFWWGRWHQII
jgi:hypothetical protein